MQKLSPKRERKLAPAIRHSRVPSTLDTNAHTHTRTPISRCTYMSVTRHVRRSIYYVMNINKLGGVEGAIMLRGWNGLKRRGGYLNAAYDTSDTRRR